MDYINTYTDLDKHLNHLFLCENLPQKGLIELRLPTNIFLKFVQWTEVFGYTRTWRSVPVVPNNDSESIRFIFAHDCEQ